MNTLITILVVAFAILGFTLIGFAYAPIIRKYFRQNKCDVQSDKFLDYLTPEIIAKLKSLKADREIYE